MEERPYLLLVEDDPEVLALAAGQLEDAGYQVARAPNANIALLLIKEGVPFHALITDVVLPGLLDGFALAELARALRPRLGVVYMTGYGEVARLRARGAAFGEILAKPCRKDTLLGAVRGLCALGPKTRPPELREAEALLC